MILQLFLPNLSGALDAISERLMTFFHIDWVFFVGSFISNFFMFFCLGWGGMTVETVLNLTSGCPLSLLHKMGFAMSSACIAQGFIQSALENLQGLALLHRSEQSVLLLD